MSTTDFKVCPRASMSVMKLFITMFPLSSKVTVFDPDKAPIIRIHYTRLRPYILYIHTYIHTHKQTNSSTCKYISVHTISTYIHNIYSAHIHKNIHTYSAYIHTYSAYIHTNIRTYSTYINTYIQCIHTVHTDIHTYIHTYSTYIHTYIQYMNRFMLPFFPKNARPL